VSFSSAGRRPLHENAILRAVCFAISVVPDWLVYSTETPLLRFQDQDHQRLILSEWACFLPSQGFAKVLAKPSNAVRDVLQHRIENTAWPCAALAHEDDWLTLDSRAGPLVLRDRVGHCLHALHHGWGNKP